MSRKKRVEVEWGRRAGPGARWRRRKRRRRQQRSLVEMMFRRPGPASCVRGERHGTEQPVTVRNTIPAVIHKSRGRGLHFRLEPLRFTRITRCYALRRYLQPEDEGVHVPQQVLRQQQPQSGLALHRLVHADVHVHRTAALRQKGRGPSAAIAAPWEPACPDPRMLTGALVTTRAFLPLSPRPDSTCWTDI